MTTFYIGPYLVIPPAPVKGTAHMRSCANNCAAPSISKTAKFCGNCGGAVLEQDVPTEVVKPLPISRLKGRWEDFMHCPEYGKNHPKGDIWLPNHNEHGLTLEQDTEDGFRPVLFSSLDGMAMLEKAQREYGEFVDMLKNEFGVQAVWEVGIIAYAD
ncbi:hypothetical protein G3A43_07925 [Paraburkholderia aspalathi]|nr:hypothetical protein [Paraburkholderia aspalathi]MBK3780183.1 hypothetical protein [Paraburkholderia aspalathi]